jgi:hypothetical protein
MDKERRQLLLAASRMETTTVRGERALCKFARVSIDELGERMDVRTNRFRIMLDGASPRCMRQRQPVVGATHGRRSTLS